jgi:nitrite reductase (NADH) small subunit
MNHETIWVRITACHNIPIREGRLAVVHGRQIAIFNLGDRFLAIDNRCPHKGGPLADGIVSGNTVVCPLHAWRIDLESGAIADPGSSITCIASFPTRISHGIVELQIPLKEPDLVPAAENDPDRDRPLRWVQRKPGVPVGVLSELS